MFKRLNERIAEKRRNGILSSSFQTVNLRGITYYEKVLDYFNVDYEKKQNGIISKEYFTISPYLRDNPNLKHGRLIERYAIERKILVEDIVEFKPRMSVEWLRSNELYPSRYDSMKNTLKVIRVWDDLLDSKENSLFLENGIRILTNAYRTTKDLSSFKSITPKNAELILQILRNLYKDPQTVEYIDKYEDYLVQKFASTIDKSHLTAASPVIDADTFSSHLITMREEEELKAATDKLMIIPKIQNAYSELHEHNT